MSDLEVLVLGSGGPSANPRRASSSFVVFVDGAPRVLVGADGRAGVAAAELGIVLLTPLGGLAPIVLSAFMEGRTRPLTLAAPGTADGLEALTVSLRNLYQYAGRVPPVVCDTPLDVENRLPRGPWGAAVPTAGRTM